MEILPMRRRDLLALAAAAPAAAQSPQKLPIRKAVLFSMALRMGSFAVVCAAAGAAAARASKSRRRMADLN